MVGKSVVMVEDFELWPRLDGVDPDSRSLLLWHVDEHRYNTIPSVKKHTKDLSSIRYNTYTLPQRRPHKSI